MPLVKQGQSIHQIYVNNLNELMCSEKTIYNYIDAGILDVKNIDLPRKVRYRPRYKKPEFKVDKGCRINRNYLDFKNFIEEHPDTSIVQMDSVMGNMGGKVLLTIHFVDTSFMLAFLREHNTSKSVIDVFSDLTDVLGIETMRKLFPVILTDNGSEFSNPKAIEHSGDIRMTNVFYCDPSAPYQKGAIEVNHELIRRVIPKGKSFNDLTQADVNRMMNHINSYKTKKLNDRCPYEAFSFLHGEDVLSKMGCLRIAPENVTLTKALFKK
jgi:IS30 family transposase